jgi:hypothetical protein
MISTIKKRLAKQGCIAVIWSIEDVKAVRPNLTDAQSIQVLEECERCHDADTGINWETVRYHANDLFPEADITESNI